MQSPMTPFTRQVGLLLATPFVVVYLCVHHSTCSVNAVGRILVHQVCRCLARCPRGRGGAMEQVL
jgi:hypothetical protein